jgi:acyl carrier protein
MKNKIREFVCKTTFSSPQKINDDTLLFDEGIFDSMGLLHLISFLEEEFCINVADSELDGANFGSIDAILSFLERKLKIEELCSGSMDLVISENFYQNRKVG